MSDESSNNGSNIVAIIAVVILAGMAIAFFIYVLPMMQQKEGKPAESPSIKIDMPVAPAPEGGAAPQPQP